MWWDSAIESAGRILIAQTNNGIGSPLRRAGGGHGGRRGGVEAVNSASAPPAGDGRDHPKGSGSRHRVAAGLPGQPPPLGSTNSGGRAIAGTVPRAPKGAGGPGFSQSKPAPEEFSLAAAKGAAALDPPAAEPNPERSDLSMPNGSRSAKLKAASTAPGLPIAVTSHAGPPVRKVLDVGEAAAADLRPARWSY
jgi:hypothetical protein